MNQYTIEGNAKKHVYDTETPTELSRRCYYSVANCGDCCEAEED